MSGPSLKQAFSHSIFGSMAESWGGGKGDGVAPRTAVSKKAHANGGGGGGGATGASGKRTKRSVRRQRQRPLADAAARAMRVRGVEMIGDVATGAVITTVDADFGTLMNGYVAYDSGYHVLNALTAALSNDKVHAPLARVSTAVFDVGLATNTAWPLSGTLNYSTAERTFDASLCASLLGATLRAARATPGRGSLKLHVPLAGAKEDKGGGKKKETGNSRLAGVLSNGSNKKSYPASLSATIDGAGDATLRLTPPRLLGGRLSFGAEADGARAASGHAHATTRAVRWAAGIKQRWYPFGSRQAVRLAMSATADDDFLPVGTLELSSRILPRNIAKWSVSITPGARARHSLRFRMPRPRGARARAEATIARGAIALDLGRADRTKVRVPSGQAVAPACV